MGGLGVTRSVKKELSFIHCDALLSRLGSLGGDSDCCFNLVCTYLRRQRSWWRVFSVEIFFLSICLYELIASPSHYLIQLTTLEVQSYLVPYS